MSETQKFGHVTYFFNGNRTGKFNEELEDYVEIPSDQVPFEQRPWMKAAEITDVVVEAMKEGKHGFIRLNYPNGDMVGHTGDYLAVEISVEAVDLRSGAPDESRAEDRGHPGGDRRSRQRRRHVRAARRARWSATPKPASRSPRPRTP